MVAIYYRLIDFIFDIQISKEIVLMDINKMMTNGINTMNGVHMQSEN